MLIYDSSACPKCGAIRFNWGLGIEKDNYIEQHCFCRQCETEWTMSVVKFNSCNQGERTDNTYV